MRDAKDCFVGCRLLATTGRGHFYQQGVFSDAKWLALSLWEGWADGWDAEEAPRHSQTAREHENEEEND